MAYKKAIAVITIFAIIALSIAAVNSQTLSTDTIAILNLDASNLISLSSTELEFVGTINEELPSRSFTIYGLLNTPVTVQIYPNELYDNSTGRIISENKLAISKDGSFSVSNSQPQRITVDLNSQDVSDGVYFGSITVTATSENGTTSASKLNIIATIKGPTENFILSNKNWSIILILALSAIGVLYQEQWGHRKYVPEKRYIVFLMAILSAYVYVYTILNYGFGDLESSVSTIIIAPYLTYSAAYLTEKRKQQIDKEKTSLTVRNEGIKEDINLIRDVLGELTTHFASFTPDYYKDNISNPKTKNAKLLFNEGNGRLSREVWDKSTKQGMIANITVLEIEKYYEFIELYNQYHSCACFISDNMSQETFEETIETPFFEKFSDFREKYGELENVLFLNLSYYLGLFNKTNLSPLNLEYPRFTRTLLKNLVNYEILDADKDIPKIKPDAEEKKFLKRFEKGYYSKLLEGKLKELFEADVNRSIDDFTKWKAAHKKNEETKQRQLDPNSDEDQFKKKFEEIYSKKLSADQLQKIFDGDKNRTTTVFAVWKINHKKKEKAKQRIEEFKIKASDLQKILNKIYHRSNIPKFYCRVEADFHEKYLALRDSIKKLVEEAPLPKIFAEKEKLIGFTKNNKDRTDLLTEIKTFYPDLTKKGLNLTPDPKKNLEYIYLSLEEGNAKLTRNIKTFEGELAKLKKQLSAGKITKEEYRKRKAEKLRTTVFENLSL